MHTQAAILSIFSLFLFTQMNHAQEPVVPEPAYLSEAPLPKGWPKPGPYNQVSEKKYPAYRAAVTLGKGEAFWRLFRHITKNNIPMTSPVEMGMKNEEGKALSRYSMAFLYQGQEVGETGADGSKVEVKDVPAAKALSYAWQGDDSKSNIKKAKEALFTELKKRKLEYSSIRMLGYNGPQVPNAKKTWELQAMLK